MNDVARGVTTRTRRRSGRRKTDALEAAALVIADRGADAARFVDVAAQSGVPVSSLQYYFGSREDLVVAAFRHASETELVALTAELAAREDPWERIVYVIDDALRGYRPGDDVAGRLWIEAWHFGLRDEEMRANVTRDYSTWQQLIEDAINMGVDQGRFETRNRRRASPSSSSRCWTVSDFDWPRKILGSPTTMRRRSSLMRLVHCSWPARRREDHLIARNSDHENATRITVAPM